MRMALALAPLGQALPGRGGSARSVEMAPPWRGKSDVATITRAEGVRRGRVGLLTGCVQRAVFPDNAATARVLAADGYEVVAPPQGCLRVLSSVHAGRLDEGKTSARSSSGRSRTSTPSSSTAGCGSHLKEVGWLLGDESAAFAAKVRDVAEFLAEFRLRAAAPPAVEGRPPDPAIRHAQALPPAALNPPAESRRSTSSSPPSKDLQPRLRRDLQHRAARGCTRARRDRKGLSTSRRRARRPCKRETRLSRSRWRSGGRVGSLPALHPIELVDASIRNVGVGQMPAARGARDLDGGGARRAGRRA